MRPTEQDVELADRGAAEAVDHQRHPVAGHIGQVLDDGIQHFVGHLVRCGEFRTAPAGLAVDAHTHLDLVVTEFEQRRPLRRRRAGREGDPHGAGDAVDLLADAHELVQVSALLGGSADGLHHEEVAGHPPATHRVGGILHGDVIVYEQGFHVHAVSGAELLRHLEGHPVAGVVVHQQQHALGRGQQLGGLVDVVHRWRREHVAGTRGVEHAAAHRHHVGRLVPGARALDDRDPVRAGAVGAHDQVVGGHVLQRVRVGQGDALEHLRNVLLRIIDEFLHGSLSWCARFGGAGFGNAGWFVDIQSVASVGAGNRRGQSVWLEGRSAPTRASHSVLSRSRITATATAPGSGEPMLRSPV
nr:hypothetical protein BJQ95_02635 [Cryobacterium sp. SO1]